MDDDNLDGCDIDFEEDLLADDPLLFALFPDGVSEEKEAEWRELFSE